MFPWSGSFRDALRRQFVRYLCGRRRASDKAVFALRKKRTSLYCRPAFDALETRIVPSGGGPSVISVEEVSPSTSGRSWQRQGRRRRHRHSPLEEQPFRGRAYKMNTASTLTPKRKLRRMPRARSVPLITPS